MGLLVGLGSGIGYGLYSILGTIALRKYSSYTVTAYTFILAAIGSWFICRPADMLYKIKNTADLGFLLFFCCLTALITAVIPFLAYTLGLESVEASKAGIIATIEPMVATLIGIVVFSEPLTIISGAGIILIRCIFSVFHTEAYRGMRTIGVFIFFNNKNCCILSIGDILSISHHFFT